MVLEEREVRLKSGTQRKNTQTRSEVRLEIQQIDSTPSDLHGGPTPVAGSRLAQMFASLL